MRKEGTSEEEEEEREGGKRAIIKREDREKGQVRRTICMSFVCRSCKANRNTNSDGKD